MRIRRDLIAGAAGAVIVALFGTAALAASSEAGTEIDQTYRSQLQSTAKGKLEKYKAYVEYVFFASGCGVFKTDAPALVLVQKHAEALDYWLMSNGLLLGDASVTMKAEQAGKERAAQRGQCDFWRRSPDAVYRLRQEALASEGY